MTAHFTKPMLRKFRVSKNSEGITRPTGKLVRAIRIALALVSANAAFPAQALITCPIQSPLTVNGSETLDSTHCEIQASGTIDILGTGSIEITNTNSLTALGNLNVNFGGQVINSGSLNNQNGATLNNAGSLTNNDKLTNSSLLNNQTSGILNNGKKATLSNDSAISNDGLIQNLGDINSSGSISGSGKLNNSGSLTIENGGSASIAQSENVSGGTLSGGGSWNVIADTNSTSLSFGDGSSPINALAANTSVTLNGADAQFQQLENNLTGIDGNFEVINHNFANPSGRDMQIGYSGRLVSYAGSINNVGNITNDGLMGEYNGEINNTGTLTNNYNITTAYGTLNNQLGATLVNNHLLRNYYGTINNLGSVTNQKQGRLINTGVFYNYGSLTNLSDAEINNQYGLLVNIADAKILNEATFNNLTGAYFYNNSGASFTNKGILNNQAGANFSTGATLYNDGLFNNGGTFGIDTPASIEGSGNFIQSEGITVVNGLLQQATIDIQGGVLTGEGTVMGNVTIGSDAELSPGVDSTIVNGSDLGKLTINGSIGINGPLLIEIAGIETGSYDVLDNINGVVSFGVGSLISINLNSLFTPEGGMKWDFLFSDNPFFGLGNTSYLVRGLSPSMVYMIGEVGVGGRYALEFTVPEPDSVVLFGLGGLLLVRWRRGRIASS